MLAWEKERESSSDDVALSMQSYKGEALAVCASTPGSRPPSPCLSVAEQHRLCGGAAGWRGGKLQIACSCCCIHVAAVETPVGCSCPGAEPSASAQWSAVTAGVFRLAGAGVNQQRGPRPALQLGTLPIPCPYTPSVWKVTKGREQSLRSSSASQG